MSAIFELIFNTLGGNIFLVIISFALLYYGAEMLVRGSVTLATNHGVHKLIVGITIVAFGTSMPEFMVSLFAKLKNSTDISVGNVIGSNIANIALILGVAAMIRPLQVHLDVIKTELPLLFAFTVIFNLLCLDGNISVLDGIILLLIFSGYMFVRIFRGKKKGKVDTEEVEKIDAGNGKLIFLIVMGIIILIAGSDLLIRGAIFIAVKFNVNQVIIGLTMVALGTSLPELFTSIVASIKKEADISIGNVIGSNFFNIFFVLGFIALFGSIEISNNVKYFQNWINLALTLILFPVMLSGKIINRFEGFLFFSFYVLFVLNLYFKWIFIS